MRSVTVFVYMKERDKSKNYCIITNIHSTIYIIMIETQTDINHKKQNSVAT